jgi:hypothetical protein
MQTALIEVDQWTARRSLNEYRKHVGPETTDEDRAIMASYAAITRGARVLDLLATFRRTGFKPGTFQPKLAVCRADAARCTFQFRAREPLFVSSIAAAARSRTQVRLPIGGLGDVTWEQVRNLGDVEAQVPVIPPRLRPKSHLRRYMILWEAEWTRVAQRDPLLIRPLGGFLYAIVAQWDMTPLEAAVAAGRL